MFSTSNSNNIPYKHLSKGEFELSRRVVLKALYGHPDLVELSGQLWACQDQLTGQEAAQLAFEAAISGLERDWGREEVRLNNALKEAGRSLSRLSISREKGSDTAIQAARKRLEAVRHEFQTCEDRYLDKKARLFDEFTALSVFETSSLISEGILP